jgi:hypothetical protein
MQGDNKKHYIIYKIVIVKISPNKSIIKYKE